MEFTVIQGERIIKKQDIIGIFCKVGNGKMVREQYLPISPAITLLLSDGKEIDDKTYSTDDEAMEDFLKRAADIGLLTEDNANFGFALQEGQLIAAQMKNPAMDITIVYNGKQIEIKRVVNRGWNDFASKNGMIELFTNRWVLRSVINDVKCGESPKATFMIDGKKHIVNYGKRAIYAIEAIKALNQ